MLLMHWPVILILVTGMLLSIWLQKLTVAGAITGGIVGTAVFAGTGYTGLILMALFFVIGTAATAWRKHQKVAEGLANEKESRRTASQVLANAGVAAILAVMALFFPNHKELFLLMLAASFSSATADTVSSELGNVYGSRFYNIFSFKKDVKGLDGVVSVEGTLAGVAGSIIVAIVFIMFKSWNTALFFIIIAAGTIGNITDSILGATVERKGILKNNSVNFLNTAIAALVAWLLYFMFEN